VLSLDSYPAIIQNSRILEYLNIVFTLIFLLEMVIRMGALGIKEYFRHRYYIFDCVIVVLSLVDIVLSFTLTSSSFSSGKGVVSAFRAFRLLRIFKLAKSWEKFQELLNTIIGSLKDISSFSILLFLFMFTYLLLGMELFANKVKYNSNDKFDLVNGTSPKQNFDNFWNALLTIFIVLTGQNWDSIMYSFARPFGAVAVVFFVSFVVIGQMILLNLFLAILLKNFDESKVVDQIDPNAERITFLDKFSDYL